MDRGDGESEAVDVRQPGKAEAVEEVVKPGSGDPVEHGNGEVSEPGNGRMWEPRRGVELLMGEGCEPRKGAEPGTDEKKEVDPVTGGSG